MNFESMRGAINLRMENTDDLFVSQSRVDIYIYQNGEYSCRVFSNNSFTLLEMKDYYNVPDVLDWLKDKEKEGVFVSSSIYAALWSHLDGEDYTV